MRLFRRLTKKVYVMPPSGKTETWIAILLAFLIVLAFPFIICYEIYFELRLACRDIKILFQGRKKKE